MRGLLILLLISFSASSQALEDPLDVLSITAQLEPTYAAKMIKGKVVVSFEVTTPVDSVGLDAYNVLSLSSQTQGAQVKHQEGKVWLFGPFQPGTIYERGFTYSMAPKKAMYFDRGIIWTQGQGMESAHWLPSRNDTRDKIIFNLCVKGQTPLRVISNGVLEVTQGMGRQDSCFVMEHPMSSYLLALVIGPFERQTQTTTSGVVIENYHRPQDSLYAAVTYRYSSEILGFLEKEIGYGYPWSNYKQVPIVDFLYAGMENTACTLFDQHFMRAAYYEDALGYFEINAHEMAHQWFGNLVTKAHDQDQWLHEGFATFYSWQAIRHILGPEQYQKELYTAAQELISGQSRQALQPLISDQGTSLDYYTKGAWALVQLQQLIGVEAFVESIKSFVHQYAYGSVTTSDFINVVARQSPVDLSAWENDWLRSSALLVDQIQRTLGGFPILAEYMALQQQRGLPLAQKAARFNERYNEGVVLWQEEIVYQWTQAIEGIDQKRLSTLLASEDHRLLIVLLNHYDQWGPQDLDGLVRQTQSSNMIVAMWAMWRLCNHFSQDKAIWLRQTDRQTRVQQQPEFRLLWLYLSANGQQPEEVHKTIEVALHGFMAPEYGYRIRSEAFSYFDLIGFKKSSATLAYLLDGSTHHYWRFREQCRANLVRWASQEDLTDLFRQHEGRWPQAVMDFVNRTYPDWIKTP
jgi:aminopeptidase N